PPVTTTAPPPVPTGGAVLIGEINAPKGFNPRSTVEALSGQLVDCYNKARAGKPDLRGKLTLQINVNEAGAVLSVDAAPGGHANDPALVSCIEGAMKAGAHFPKPGGMATVNAPLVFRP
ncbi:MAG TPA: AgmX/PglI C-terminal domain-containing protein, partial [Polyangiaceae bacterium]